MTGIQVRLVLPEAITAVLGEEGLPELCRTLVIAHAVERLQALDHLKSHESRKLASDLQAPAVDPELSRSALSVLVPASLDDALTSFCTAFRLTRSELLIQAIADYLGKFQEPTFLAQFFLEKYEHEFAQVRSVASLSGKAHKKADGNLQNALADSKPLRSE